MLQHDSVKIEDIPAGNFMFKVNNRNTRTRCEICSKLTLKIPERRWDETASRVIAK